MNSKKPGVLPRLEQLQSEQKDALFHWLAEDSLTYAKAQKKLESEYGVRTSAAALSAFWHSYCVPKQQAIDAARFAASVRGKLLVEIQVCPSTTGGVSIKVIGGNIPATVQATKDSGITRISVRSMTGPADVRSAAIIKDAAHSSGAAMPTDSAKL